MKRLIVLVLLVLATATPWAQTTIVADVRALIAKSDLAGAERLANEFRTKNGNTPEALAALSWVGRGLLAAGQNERASQVAEQTHKLALEVLKTRSLDADKVLPIALGAAIETEAKALAATGQRASAVSYLREQGAKYKSTSIFSRLQKNLHLLSLEGQPAPPLTAAEYLGAPKPVTTGKPVLLFFWAHWCPDCKAQAPIVADIQQRYKDKGLIVLGPTRRYGYMARGAEAGPAEELKYIEEVRKQYYGAIDMHVPVSNDDALGWGMDSTPTLALVDRAGKVAMYHPGQMTREELEARIETLLRQGASQ
ncbi:MAG: TlpA family protein disulfide reductase [Vicinamibacterales bacterium]